MCVDQKNMNTLASDNEGSHRVIPVQQTSAFQCKRGTKIYLVPEWKLYQYHVNTP